jgi:hypothetical protein
MNLTRDQRIDAATRRVKDNVSKRDTGGYLGAQILDLSKIGGYRKDLYYKPADKSFCSMDILAFIVKNKNYPAKDMIGFPDYVLDLWVHRFVGASKGAYVCLKKTFGKPCPCCEEVEILQKDKTANEEEIKALLPKRRCWYNIVDLELPEKDQKVQIFEESHWLFEKHLLLAATTRGGGYTPFHDIELGKSIEFYAVQQHTPKGNPFNYERIQLKDRPPYTEAIYNEVFPLDEMLIIPTYEEVRNALYSLDVEEIPSEVEESVVEKEPVQGRTLRSFRGAEISGDRTASPSTSLDCGDGSVLERPARQLRPRVAEKPKLECPFKHKFGEDNKAFQECNRCDAEVYDPCEQEYNRITESNSGPNR